ncbi:enhancer of split mgamma protein-like isoform X2 [Haliotis rubra]|uniref:enhancer of split mgamma protein-like isoform X2 n=1 Tax=Haliotis rubra TaxID=36100 RepID=UPI001EE552F7|nr:enhancer of split mgamma protein-like isoform X2 [Haliotis rubra]
MESHFYNLESESEYMGRRKGRKLMAEKRRRARINQSLTEIKDIVCEAQQRNDPNYDKMEKAEILETTVDYLRNVRKINTTHQHVKEAVQARFQHGFSKCAEEILSYIQSVPGVSDNVHRQLRKHISRRMTHIQQVPVTSSTEDTTSYTRNCYERLSAEPSHNSQYPHPAAHAYMSGRVDTSPVKEDNSFSDSGYAGSPDITKQSTHRTGHYHPSNLSDSELCKIESSRIHKNFDDSRVRAWLQSTWSYSQQIKTEQQVPWRPW